ncbi:mycofactocin-coupled SDR family oxidoreductase [Gordonia sp. HNM0687]|uniref:Mycofactocin-coupled SDR family oxidoreductase n=1 Tax=Gordonia mangrovi TaxID=2665643 RepID=A0A6L7GX61_9ACTN|nr:mycofactocin-coupled SDR family oxidoreductase [Gordonia mangrovi]MXP24152.1 mycofactocin-coupled SDR family oxidoreductase [Gordonia mangrovi]UVF76957.1 mycofactocin-coupled SDR family oxidoreductase [Gordonia mangrovi]
MGQFLGKVALITGAGRGQGRAHAVRLAGEGASIVALDLPAESALSVDYLLSKQSDLEETARLVTETGSRVLPLAVDVRDQSGLDDAVASAMSSFGSVDVVCANAGIAQRPGNAWEITDETWQDVLDIDLTGVWRTLKAVIPSMIELDKGGSIVIVGSSLGIKAQRNLAAYIAAKHGVTGLMKAFALELAPYRIRVNSVNPSSVATDMLLSDRLFRLFRPDLDNPTADDCLDAFRSLNALPVPWAEPEDISAVVSWLASDESRHVTGVALPADAGATLL